MLRGDVTVEDFEAMPRDVVRHAEIVDGRLVELASKTLWVNRLRCALAGVLGPAARYGGVGMIITGQAFAFHGDVYAPQISLIASEDFSRQEPDRRVQRFVPRMAVELAMSRDEADELVKKTSLYRRCGTREVWIFLGETRQAIHLTPERQVILQEHERFEPESVPGVSMAVGEVLDLH